MEKKVLMICPLFPPIGGIGVNRSLNIAKRLNDKGYIPVIATLSLADIKKFNFPIDPALEKSVEKVDIKRIDSGYPFSLVRLMQRLRIFRFIRFFLYHFFWEQQAFWSKNAYEELSNLIEKEGISLLYTTSGPFSTLLLGKKLRTKTGVPWIADLRDPYTDAYNHSFPSRLHWWLARRVEAKVLRIPDLLVVTATAQRDLYVKKGIRNPESIRVIYNGF